MTKETEIVAKAIYDALMEKPRQQSVHVPEYEETSSYHKNILLRQAKAAIAAIKKLEMD